MRGKPGFGHPAVRLNDSASTSPRRRFWKQVLLWALVHFLVLQALAGLIFITQRIPPRAVNLDGVIEVLVRVEDVLVWPRWVLGKLWPWETTPRGFGLVLTLCNSLAWGTALTIGRQAWRRVTT